MSRIPECGEGAPAPASLFEMFRVFNRLALHGFGGVLPWAQRVLVEERRWLTHAEFLEMLAFAQLAPGPNVCNLAIMFGDRHFGWRGAVVALAGMLAMPAGGAGAWVASVGILLPSSLLCLYGNRLQAAHRDSRLVRVIRRGLSPIAIGLTLSAGWIIAVANDTDWKLALLTVAAAAFFLFSRRNPLWLMGAGAIACGLGIV